jgi:hypothetical protein
MCIVEIYLYGQPAREDYSIRARIRPTGINYLDMYLYNIAKKQVGNPTSTTSQLKTRDS